MDLFDITHKSHLLIYGAGTLGQRYAKKLKNEGYLIEGYIDRNADKITIDNMTIYNLEQLLSMHDVENYVVIVVVHNVLWHQEIADGLYRKGVRKILYLPQNSSERNVRLRNAYNSFMNYEFSNLNSIPVYQKNNIYEMLDEEVVISQEGEFITVWMSSEILFSDYSSESEETVKYDDVPLWAMKAHRELFEFFEGNNCEIEEYIKMYRNIHNSQHDYTDYEFLKERYDVYCFLQKKMSSGLEYFKESPIYAKWNKKGYFNIYDGHHRAIFLLTKNIRYFPVRIKKIEYDIWKNKEIVQRIITQMKIQKIIKIQTPIENPYLQRMGFLYENQTNNSWRILYSYIMQNGIYIESLIEMGEYAGYFCRNFRRVGIKKIYYFSVKKDEYDIVKLYNSLFYMENEIDLIKEDEKLQAIQCDLIILAHFDYNRLSREMFEVIKKARYIFWISGKDANNEMEIISNLKEEFCYHKITNIFSGEYISEIGFFCR